MYGTGYEINVEKRNSMIHLKVEGNTLPPKKLSMKLSYVMLLFLQKVAAILFSMLCCEILY